MIKIKKLIVESPKIVISFILGAIVFSIIGVYAATTIPSAQVKYTENSQSTVQGALDTLYAKAKQKEGLCKEGYYTTSTGTSNYTCTKITGTQQVISLKLNGSGNQQFLSEDFNNNFPPDYVYVDGVSITPAASYNFTSGGEHKVVLVWDDDSISSTSSMFKGCDAITSLDLSNFDTSNVRYMIYMFYGCTSLTSLDLSNFDISNVLWMDYMFAGVPNGIAIKSNTATCNRIASDSGITASYTCGQ